MTPMHMELRLALTTAELFTFRLEGPRITPDEARILGQTRSSRFTRHNYQLIKRRHITPVSLQPRLTHR